MIKKKVLVPMSVFKKHFPYLSDDATMVECVEGVCHLPLGGVDVQLDIQFIYTDPEEVVYTICAATFMNTVMYFPKVIDGQV